MLLVTLVVECQLPELANGRLARGQQGQFLSGRGEQRFGENADLVGRAVHADVDRIAIVGTTLLRVAVPGAVRKLLGDRSLEVVVTFVAYRERDRAAVGDDDAVGLGPRPRSLNSKCTRRSFPCCVTISSPAFPAPIRKSYRRTASLGGGAAGAGATTVGLGDCEQQRQ